MSRDDRVRLRHMADAIEAASKFVEGRSRSDLDADRMLVFALVRAGLPAVPWSSIVGMRNRLIHAYFDVNLDILWNTVTRALPPLGEQIQAALGEFSRGTDE